MIARTKSQWDALYGDVVLVLTKLTATRVKERQWTQRDKAMAATQAAFDRMFRCNPPGLESVDAMRRYLVWAARSELSNALEQHEARGRAEEAAAVEHVTTNETEGRSPEQMHLDEAERADDKSRTAQRLEKLRKACSRDRRVLQTLDCIEQGVTEPAAQAEMLCCSVEVIHAARKRRSRAAQKIVDAERAGEQKDDGG